MSEQERAEAAEQFSKAADLLVDACRKLEQLGMEDPPVERLLLALDEVTYRVHQMHPPGDRLRSEAADLALPSWRVATLNAVGPNRPEPDPRTT